MDTESSFTVINIHKHEFIMTKKRSSAQLSEKHSKTLLKDPTKKNWIAEREKYIIQNPE